EIYSSKSQSILKSSIQAALIIFYPLIDDIKANSHTSDIILSPATAIFLRIKKNKRLYSLPWIDNMMIIFVFLPLKKNHLTYHFKILFFYIILS
ncbi:MAG TPA: hypothetical protein PLC16_08030, partial [Defluviitaleaceae bacterium]|nr:hypothetical protein [Defluviitaleaceae bacterium]